MKTLAITEGTLAYYYYDGLGRRTVTTVYVSLESSSSSGDVPSESISSVEPPPPSSITTTYWFTSNWQNIEEWNSEGTNTQHVWGARYVDELVCRDVNDLSSTDSDRLYVMQDANFNVTAIFDMGGTPVERYMYDPYGNRTIMNESWTVIGRTKGDANLNRGLGYW